MPGDEPVVSLRDVVKAFGEVVALDGFDLSVAPSRVTVLVGPNGAGKTTALRLLTGALTPDEGSALTFGLDPSGSMGDDVRRRCGMFSAKPALYDRLSGYENLRYSAELYEVGPTWPDRIAEAAARFGIDHALDQQVGGYSTGMKTRLALARAVLHEPDLLLLDEPTSGLDPESSHAVLGLIGDMASQGKTVVMCTHLLLEAEGLADDLVVMDAGRTLVAGPPDDLARQVWPGVTVRLEALDGPPAAALVEAAGGRVVDDGLTTLVVEVADLAAVPRLIDHLRDEGVLLTRVDTRRPTLDELYFALRGLRGTST
ncbi:MAG TPA: ABC transporter ATP-binding protein [Acidimicrobiales bacterium]